MDNEIAKKAADAAYQTLSTALINEMREAGEDYSDDVLWLKRLYEARAILKVRIS